MTGDLDTGVDLPLMQTIADGLLQQGWVMVDGIFPPALTSQLAGEAMALWQQGEFQRAAVGRAQQESLQTRIRSDFIHWLHEPEASAAQRRYLAFLERLRQVLNQELFLGLFEFEGHLAVYPPGSFYKKHLDQFQATDVRQVTAILYLNSEWQEPDGGKLRLYLDADSVAEHIDVAPIAGRLVVFLSGRFYHEVLPAQRQRISLTGWFRRRDGLP